MDRRGFLKTIITSTGAIALAGNVSCQSAQEKLDMIPKGKPPNKLRAANIPQGMDWHEKNFLTCFQGLINRGQPKIYFIHTEADMFWLNNYQKSYGIENEIYNDPYELIRRFTDELDGYILYDPEMPHSLNLATMLGGLKNGVPISKDMEAIAQKLGLKRIENLCGRWQNIYQAYEWAIKELQPQCNQRIMAQLCVHHPLGITSTFMNRDYVIAHQMFCFDLSSCERDKKDYNLLAEVYRAFPAGALVIGWHCSREHEHEAIALQSRHGHFGMCTLHTPNLTVHSSIQLPKGKTFKQRTVEKRNLKVEDKIYIAYQTTDGDATWFVLNLINTDWANPQHGAFKYSWGFLPLAYELMPGMVQFYFENLKNNDYFVAGPSGATYTYPHMHPDPKPFLRLTKYDMQKCGLNAVHITNWNDRDWWQEVELPDFHELLRKYLPNCVGYMRGMGESAFEKHYIAGGKPYIFCGEGIHRGSDIYQTMKDFIDACPNRPLFIYNLVNHTTPMDQIKLAMDRFPENEIELVHVDELLLLIEKAYDEGKITEELYPEKEGLRNIIAKEAKAGWQQFYETLLNFRLQYQDGEASYVENIRQTPLGVEQIVPGDFLAFATIWHGMKLIKLALESQGIYVNHKPTATKQFLKEFSHLEDVAIVADLQKLWDDWHHHQLTFSEAKAFADRLLRLAELLSLEYSLEFKL